MEVLERLTFIVFGSNDPRGPIFWERGAIFRNSEAGHSAERKSVRAIRRKDSSNASTSAGFGSFSAAFSTTGLGSSLGTLSEPNGFIAGIDYTGPNFEYQLVPQPSTLALFGLGLAALRLRWRRLFTVAQ